MQMLYKYLTSVFASSWLSISYIYYIIWGPICKFLMSEQIQQNWYDQNQFWYHQYCYQYWYTSVEIPSKGLWWFNISNLSVVGIAWTWENHQYTYNLDHFFQIPTLIT